MAARDLRAVPAAPEGGKRKPGRPRKTVDQGKQGAQAPQLPQTERETLVFLHDTLKGQIQTEKGQALASLVRQFRQVDADLRSLDMAAQKAAQESEEVTDEDWNDDEI